MKHIRNFFSLRPRRLEGIPMSLNLAQSVGIIFAQLLDVKTTLVGLNNGASEANGLMARLIETWGTEGFFTVKIVGALFLIWCTWSKPVAAWVVTLICMAAALWNLTVISAVI